MNWTCSANTGLRAQVQLTYDLIQETAVPLMGQYGSNCGGDHADGPNHDWGNGLIDSYTAAQEALALGQPGHLTDHVADMFSSQPSATPWSGSSWTMAWSGPT